MSGNEISTHVGEIMEGHVPCSEAGFQICQGRDNHMQTGLSLRKEVLGRLGQHLLEVEVEEASEQFRRPHKDSRGNRGQLQGVLSQNQDLTALHRARKLDLV